MVRSPPTATFPSALGADQGPVRRRWVHVHGPGGPGGEVPLPNTRLVVGRDPGAEGLRLEDETASRCHAELEYWPSYDCFRIRDLESKNGIFVDGQRAEEAVLDAGTVVRIGANLFVLEELRVPEAAELQPPVTVSLTRAWAELLVDRAGPTGLPVLLRGPTGAGKERLAQRVHEVSERAGPLVPVNCAAITPELIGSELFGHVRGAFSEAKRDRTGLVASAEGGTLFLDEIAELPLEQQSTLLRVVQERRVRPVGSDRELPVDVRFVAATHVDLQAACRAKTFRQDLYARLAGLEVELPGLAERRVEILPLFEAFAPGLTLDTFAAERLLLYAWPRNIRELELLAQRLVAVSTSVRIGVELLPAGIQVEPAPAEASVAAEHPPPPAKPSREELEALLSSYRGRVADVARALAVTRQSVYRMMAEFDLSAAEFRRRS